jgi:predicted alpha-1,2-mannosidase
LKRISCLFFLFINSFLFSQTSYTKYVNPFIGTGGHGHTFPGVTAPFGMVQLSPDTRIDNSWDGCSGYHFDDKLIYGFSHTHLSGTGVSDYCDILLFPFSGKFNSAKKYSSSFNHKDETASPGYYSVMLKDESVKAEFTATERTGFHQYTFTVEKDSAGVLIDLIHRDKLLSSQVKQIDEKHLSGYRRSSSWASDQIVFFYLECSEPFKLEMVTYDSLMVSSGPDSIKIFSGKNYGYMKLKLPETHSIKIKVSLSAVSEDGAKKNMLEEIPDMDFEKTKMETKNKWEKELGKIEVSGGSNEQLTNFYTALYHCMIAPNIYNDVDGKYRGRDNQIHSCTFNYYTVFSLWDTFRAWHPLMTIIDQARTTNFINTFLRQFKEGGLLPVWELSSNETECMIGYHSVSVITDAYMKGIGNFNTSEALSAMKKSAESRQRYGLNSYIDQGYIDVKNENESVSKTLEYAYDDWCISTFANAIGRTDVGLIYKRRSNHWQNLFDPSTKFFRARLNGGWLKPLDPSEVNNNFTEANAWQYCFFVPHDLQMLACKMGGKDMFEKKLDELFNADSKTTGRDQADITGLIGQYAHGNEPSHNIAWLYNYTNNPWKTQFRTQQICNEMYHAKPDGLIGNEDCGQMSAWYVMSAMGIYQVCPGNNLYDLSVPLFDDILIHFENGKTMHIKKESQNRKNNFIDKVILNGKENGIQITHASLMQGGELVFNMTSEKKTIPAMYEQSAIRSTNECQTDFISSPVPEFSSSVFKDSVVVSFSTVSNQNIFYTLNGNDPDENANLYSSSIVLSKNTVLKAIAISRNGKFKSYITTSEFHKMAHPDWKIKLISTYNRQYTAGGDEGLIDGLRGDENWRKGGWQGFQGQDFEAIIDLGKETTISFLGADFLQDTRSWILMPVKIDFEASNDYVTFENISSIGNALPDTVMETRIISFGGNVKPVTARYIKVKAKNYGKLPVWHPGAGSDAFIFIDEIYIK